MKPAPGRVLTVAAQRLQQLGQERSAEPEGPELTRIADVLRVLASEWDSAVEDRVRWIADLESLLHRARHPFSARPAAERGPTRDVRAEDLRISTLECRLDELRAAAIELEAMLECQDSTDSATLLAELRAWELDDARRRTLLAAPW